MKTLTPNKVVEAMPRCGPWHLLANGSIRNEEGECPGCAALRVLHGEHGFTIGLFVAAEIHGVRLTIDHAAMIVRAADMLPRYLSDLRARMLAAGGLS